MDRTDFAASIIYNPSLRAVVVATHSQEWQVGQALDVWMNISKQVRI